ncbi:UvrD-helicase domain-containing protein [Streptomyces albidoflavus]
MLIRSDAAPAELQDPSAGLEVKVARRKWNPALHPRDSKGRFIETGGIVRLWGGKLARVVRALPNDRVLVQDRSGPNTYKGRRHTTSARWVSMVARPNGSAPTTSRDKVSEEDEKRALDRQRGNGIARDDDGTPDAPPSPHDRDDEGNPIGDDEGEAPDERDDEDEPADGTHPVNLVALPNKQHTSDARFKDTRAVRQHFLGLAEQPDRTPQMAHFLRAVAVEEDLRTTRDGRLAILQDDTTGRWYLTATGTGQRMTGAGDFSTPREATRFAAHLNRTTSSNKPQQPGEFDFSSPDLDRLAATWRTDQGEAIQDAIVRARTEFTAKAPAAKKTSPPKKRTNPRTPAASSAPAAPSPAEEGLRYEWDRPENLVTLTLPAAVVDFLNDGDVAMEDPDTRRALRQATRGRSGTLKVTGPLDVHADLLKLVWPIAGGDGVESDPREARAYRAYEKRIDSARQRKTGNATPAGPSVRAETAPALAPTEPAPASVPAPDDAPAGEGPDRAAPPSPGSQAPSSMADGEIRDEIVSLMEREMAAGGELAGVDRTRLRVLEAEEARRAGRPLKQENPRPKPEAEEPGGLFEAEPDAPQRNAPDPDNPLDQPDDEFGTPDMIAAAEGRDTSRLRPVQVREPLYLDVGDRFVDTDGRTYSVAERPTLGRRGVRIVSEGGKEHFRPATLDLRVLEPDEPEPGAPAASDGDGRGEHDGAIGRRVADDAASPERGSGSDAGAPDLISDREPSGMASEEIADELDGLEEVVSQYEETNDPLERAYLLRAERRQWALRRARADRWKPAPEFDDKGNPVERKRGEVLRERADGYGLNQDEARGAASTVDELPPAKPGGYADDEWEKIDAEVSAREAYPPTDEQRVIIEGAARRGLDMRVMALAGTGKSTTLKMLSQRMPDKRILYLAFNRSVADEAIESQQRGEYAKNLTPTTANAYANSMVDRALLDRLKWPRLNDQQLADRMRWYDPIPAAGGALTPRRAAHYANTMLREWVKSDDRDFAVHHLPSTLSNRDGLFDAVKPLAEQMWANLTDAKAGNKDRDLPLSFDDTVKMWALSDRVPDADVLFWDEAQDVNPVMEGIVRNARQAGIQIVAVGDSNQAIYGFRGATDALGRLPADATATLTQTFRFGDAVADAGNRFLRLVGTRMRLKGWDRKDSRLAEITPGDETMLIARTNAGAVLGAVEGLQAGRKVAIAGGLNDLRKFLEAAEALSQGKRTNHQELAQFNGRAWDDIREEVAADKDLKQLDSMFKLMEKHAEHLETLLNAARLPRPAIEDDGEHMWVKLAFGDRNFATTKDWLKDNGFGWDGVGKRWGYPPPKKAGAVSEAERARVLEKVERYIAERYTAPESANGGQVVDQAAPHDLLVSTAHKAKGLESERVRIAGDFFGPKETANGGYDWDTVPKDEDLRLAYVALTRATDVLDVGSLGWVYDLTRDDDPMVKPDGEYLRDWEAGDFEPGMRVSFVSEGGDQLIEGTVETAEPGNLLVRSPDGSTTPIVPEQVTLREGQGRPQLPVASPEELDEALRAGRFVPGRRQTAPERPDAEEPGTVRLSQEAVRDTLASIRPDTLDAPDDTAGAQPGETDQPEEAVDENGMARTLMRQLPDLPRLPKLSGLSRQDKDSVRRIRGDYAKIHQSLNGILAGDPPTGDAREDLRRVREQLDYVAGRLNRDLLPDNDEAQAARATLHALGEDMDRALAALPDREPQPQGEGPNGGTLFHPWDLREGDLFRADAISPAYVAGGPAPYYGTYHGSSSASGEQGRTLLTYQGFEWNRDRQQWENRGGQHTVIVPPRGLAERFTPEQWDAWRQPERSQDDAPTPAADPAPGEPELPAVPIGETAPKGMSDDEIAAELEALEAWRQRHIRAEGEGPSVPRREVWEYVSRIGERRGSLLEENQTRAHARRRGEEEQKRKEERAAALARAEIGKRDGDGSYPVTVDGENAGTVRQLARKWRYINADGDRSPDEYKSRGDAVAALVFNRDVRRENAAEEERREQARAEAPDGWALGDRGEVAENDIIRTPISRMDGDGRPYPVGWRQPVRVTRVERNDNGTAVLSVVNPDGSRSDISPVFLSHPEDTFVWANDRVRPEPTPAWRHELRARMADIGDDIASLRRTSEGIDDQERMARLQDLIQRVEQGDSEDLAGDLRRIRDETGWLEGEYSKPGLPWETSRRKSWATAARGKAQAALDDPEFPTGQETPEGPGDAPHANQPSQGGRAARARDLFGQGMNAVGGESLPEMQEINDRLERAEAADDRQELEDLAGSMDALAEQYELAGPQGEHAADRFRRAARAARGDHDDTDAPDTDRPENGNAPEADSRTGRDTPEQEDDESEESGTAGRRRPDRDNDGGASDADPDGSFPNGADRPDSSAGDAADPDQPSRDQRDRDRSQQDGQRRRSRDAGSGAQGGGPNGPQGPLLPHANLPHRNDRDEPETSTPRSLDTLRADWNEGRGLTAAEDTPERRAYLAQLAGRNGLALSPGGRLALWPDDQGDGTTVWRFAQARNGTNLPGITLDTANADEARELAGRFEEIADAAGTPFAWDRPWGAASVASWRDGQGRTLPQALRAVRDDYDRQRSGGYALPDDLTGLDDDSLEAAVRGGLGPDDMLRVMAEMDRRDGLTDQRIRAAVPDTPPGDAEEAERRGRAMDEALGFGSTDVTRPAEAEPGPLRREFDALDAERFQAATEATGGRLLAAEAEAEGADPRAVFSGGRFSNRRAQELASPELREWWESNGRLTYPQYRQREADRALRSEFTDLDEARYLAAVDFTNGYFFQRQHGESDIDERELFSGGSLSSGERWRQYASEELQEWFDANGGRLTYNAFKERRRAEMRVHREEQERETRQAPAAPPTSPAYDPSTPRFTDLEAVRAHLREGELDELPEGRRPEPVPADRRAAIAAADTTRLSNGGRLLIYEEREGVESRTRRYYHVALPGSLAPLFGEPFLDLQQAMDAADLLEGLKDGRGEGLPFDAPDVVERIDAFRTPEGRSLREAFTVQRIKNMDVWKATPAGSDMTRLWAREMWEEQRERWVAESDADGYTIPVDPADILPGDEITYPMFSSRSQDVRKQDLHVGPAYATVTGEGAPARHGHPSQFSTVATPDAYEFPANQRRVNQYGKSSEGDVALPQMGDVRRRPRPGENAGGEERPESAQTGPEPEAAEPLTTPDAEAAPEQAATPEPVGGQPAHWARVEDLVPGDLVRADGTTKRGRRLQVAGYVYAAPTEVSVTRRGRSERMWRTWITDNADGSGAAGNVYTPLTATVARAEAPEDVVPGSPANGAQVSVRSGDLPDQIPADRGGRGLFPGSTVTGPGDREGTVTGATDTTVSVRWANGNEEPALSPSTLTATDSRRPDGWTGNGQRLTTQHVVSDADGALLGPVEGIDGDTVTITTTDGSISRSARGLRVAGEIRDEPSPASVADVEELAAADLSDGDVVLLDLDGRLAAVTVTSPPSRDGDRIAFQYRDTISGEAGEIDVDARTVLPRAQGPDGGAPQLGPADAPAADDDLVVHAAPRVVEPVTGRTVEPQLDPASRSVASDHADSPGDDPEAQQAAVRIAEDLPVSQQQAGALATQLRAAADPSTTEGRAALRAADHLDRAAGRTPPPGISRPSPANAAQLGEGDLVAMPDEGRGDQVRAFRVIDAEDGPGGVRRFLLEDQDETRQWRRRVVHGAMPVWLLPETEPAAASPPDSDDVDNSEPARTGAPSAPADPASLPVSRARPGDLRVGDVVDAPVRRSGYQLNGHHRLTIVSEPQRNGWWTQITGVDEDGNVHDVGLHSARAVNVYDRNRPTPSLPPLSSPRDPNVALRNGPEAVVGDHARGFAARIIEEAIVGTEPPGTIHALREQIAARLSREALRSAHTAASRDGAAALDAAGVTGPDRKALQQRLRRIRQRTRAETVRATLRTLNDLEPLPGETEEELAARARDLLRLIPEQIAPRVGGDSSGADPDVARTVFGYADDAVNALLHQLQVAGMGPDDAARLGEALTRHLAGSRPATARRIASRIAAASPDAARSPGLVAQVAALLVRLARRLAELVKAGARLIAEKYRSTRDRLARLRAFLGRLVRRVRQWPEARRLARLHRAVNLPDADGGTLAARTAHWASLMPEPGRFGQAQQRFAFWRPTAWARLAAGRLPERADRIQWAPDRAADGGPGLTALRHLAALRAAGTDVDQEVTRRLSAALGDDFGDDPHATVQEADDHVAGAERRLVSLLAARSGATIADDPDLEVEIASARAELAGARREYADLRARYATAVPDAVAATLAELREMGPQGAAALVFGADTNPDAERAVRGVQRLVPRAWLNTPAVRRLDAVGGEESRYEPGAARITVADLADEGLGSAGHALAQHLARHLGDLDAAQRAYWFSRTHTGRPGARHMRRTALGRLLRRQQTQPETGDTLARSLQALFGGDWYLDDDLRAFLLGLLATR